MRGLEVRFLPLAFCPRRPGEVLRAFYYNGSMTIPILYEDNSLIVINKPAGLLVHGLRDGNTSEVDRRFSSDGGGGAHETLVDWFLKKHPDAKNLLWPDATRPGIVHRLDRDTSGVMVIAKTPEVLAQLQQAFANRIVTKVYQALVVGSPDWEEQTVRAAVSRGEGTKRRANYLKLDTRAKDAETHMRVLRRFSSLIPDISLLEAMPLTGRTHQIRVHLWLLGFPILGDPWYQTKASRQLAQALAVTRLMLHAQQLSFPHPESGEVVIFEAPVPPDFQAVLQGL